MKPLYTAIAILLLIFNGKELIAQPELPDNGEVYIKSVVPRVDILIHPDTLTWIYENVDSDHEFRAVLIFNNGNVHDTLNNIGFRLRGNTSRVSEKKSFKVSFNTFILGRVYHGIEKMNLNGEHNDPSVSRALIYWEILRESGIAGPRANHVELYINGNYHGLYLNVEHIDEEFTDSYFGSKNGNLYKCTYGADLRYKSSNPDSYKFGQNSNRVYELTTNEETDDYSDLAEFISILNNTSIADLPCRLEGVFNVQDYLKIAAIDVLTGNWDGYIFNKNNFYLYKNPATGLFEYIPYDVDNTFGIDWFNIDWSKRNIYNWAHSDPRPLFKRLLQVPEYKLQFTYYLKQVIASVTSTQSLNDRISAVRDLIRPYVVNDPFYPLDYGYNIQSFNTSWTGGTGAHVPDGIFPFINTRNNSAIAQAMTGNTPPMVKYIKHNNPLSMQRMVITAHVEDENLAEVYLEYKFTGGSWKFQAMNDLGIDGDLLANDSIFSTSLSGMKEETVIQFRVKASDDALATITQPCVPYTYIIPAIDSRNLVINEIMTNNNSIIADEHGDYDDWIELYNGGEEYIWLGDKYLTDNIDNPDKWKLPDTIISPGSYLIIWADGDEAQGPAHASFKLSKDNEEVGLFDNDASGNLKIDALFYTWQTTDVSMGRVTDGSPEWQFFSTPTPGRSNSEGEIAKGSNVLRVWPNPVVDGYIYLDERTDFSIYDVAGRLLMNFTDADRAEISSLKHGVFIVRSKDGKSAKIILP